MTLGHDLTDAECSAVQAVIAEFADCFALAIKEVNAILGTVHKLNIPEGASFGMKIPLRMYNPDQHAFIEAKVDEMLEAGIICSIHPRDVQFVTQTVLAHKVHEGDGLTLDKLKHQVNDQCNAHGLPNEFEMPPRPEPCEPNAEPAPDKPKKWRMWQNFGGINKVTEIVPVPQGDIRAKQLQISGH